MIPTAFPDAHQHWRGWSVLNGTVDQTHVRPHPLDCRRGGLRGCPFAGFLARPGHHLSPGQRRERVLLVDANFVSGRTQFVLVDSAPVLSAAPLSTCVGDSDALHLVVDQYEMKSDQSSVAVTASRR